jgi:hypothetical protein
VIERGRKQARLEDPTQTLASLGLSSADVEREMAEFMTEMRTDFGGMV